MHSRLVRFASTKKRLPSSSTRIRSIIVDERIRSVATTTNDATRRSGGNHIVPNTSSYRLGDENYRSAPSLSTPPLLLQPAEYHLQRTHRYYFSSSPAATTDAQDESSVAADNARRRRLALRKRRKKMHPNKTRKKKPGTIIDPARQLRRHEATAFGQLFDTIAPTNSLVKLDELVERLQTTIADDNVVTVLPLVTVLLGMLHSTNPNNTIQIQVLEFVLSATKGSSLKSGLEHAAAVEVDADDDELIDEDDAIQILRTARDFSMQHAALGWNRLDLEEVTKEPDVLEERQAMHAARSEGDLQAEAQQLSVTLRASLPPKNFRSVIRIFETYIESQTPVSVAESTLDRAGDDLSVSDSGDSETEQGPKASTTSPTTKKKKKKRFVRKIRFELEKISGAQFHLVAADTADFFYMNVGLDYNVTSTDPRIQQLHEKWMLARERFVEAMLGIQEKLLASVEDVDDDIAVVIDRETATDNDAIEPELQRLTQVPRKKGDDRRFRRPAHVVFDAMVLHEAINNEDIDDSLQGAPVILPSQKTVFVDSLPIDINKDEVIELYSRCGDLDSVQIFNQYTDLDPGPLPQTQIAARQKKQLQSVRTKFRKWQRPRTPVYAMLTFSDILGSQRALEDSLRIFGIVIRKHPVRSFRSSDMTSLYLEGLPEGQPCIDLEYQLSQQLHPNLFVCLDAGQNNRAVVGSCEINFPSFEAAIDSYHKLQELDLFKKSDAACRLHWMRTPKDAIQWWTRKRGFE